MIHLLTTPGTARRALRGVLGAVTDFATRAADTWTHAVDQAQTAAEPTEAPDPADVLDADEIPDVATIERAALSYDLACDNARRADRGKRAAKKVIGRLPSGVYGAWKVFRTPSSRTTPDLAAITATYKANGWGPVPMKPCAPSLKVERVELADTTTEQLAEVAA